MRPKGMESDGQLRGLRGHVTLSMVHLARKTAKVRKENVAHHGKAEYGAPVPPKTTEQALVHYVDMINTEGLYFAEVEGSAAVGIRLPKIKPSFFPH